MQLKWCFAALLTLGLVTYYGEKGVGVGDGRLQQGKGEHDIVKFYPFKKGGPGKSFSHAEGGHKILGSFTMGA